MAERSESIDAYSITCYPLMDRPMQHLEELLLRGTIWKNNYRILAIFHGTLELKDVGLSVQGWTFDARIPVPKGFAHSTQTSTICARALRETTEDFRSGIYSLTGSSGGVKLNSLLRSISRIYLP
jgi:hypothetical protein